VELSVEHIIHAAPEEVAEIMFNPDNETEWSSNAEKVERITPGPIGVGSQVRRERSFLGNKVSWLTEVTAIEPGARLEMNILEAPLPGVMVYEVRPTAGGAIAIVRTLNLANIPGVGWAVRRSMEEDLERLGHLVTRRHA
jgi:hypothetical protein